MPMQWIIIYCCIIFKLIHCNAEDASLCVENSAPHVCGTLCEPSCSNPKPIFCPRIVCSNITRGCRCDDGFLRDPHTGNCVRSFQCMTCPPGQALLACGTMCEGTCEAPYEPQRCQYIRCLLPGCGCDLNSGMVRDNSTHTCIPMLQCSQHGDDTTELVDH